MSDENEQEKLEPENVRRLIEKLKESKVTEDNGEFKGVTLELRIVDQEILDAALKLYPSDNWFVQYSEAANLVSLYIGWEDE